MRPLLVVLALSPILAGPTPAAAQDDSARYLVLFEATWQASTHPVDIPMDPHFSPLVAASHDGSVAFWTEGVSLRPESKTWPSSEFRWASTRR